MLLKLLAILKMQLRQLSYVINIQVATTLLMMLISFTIVAFIGKLSTVVHSLVSGSSNFSLHSLESIEELPYANALKNILPSTSNVTEYKIWFSFIYFYLKI